MRPVEHVQIADALADIHAGGLIHQDLKPDNIVITLKGAAKLLDVDLAAWTTGETDRARAATVAQALDAATARRTAAYMSPEQAVGGAFDHRTDVFSLGAVLFEMLTGRQAFAVETPAAISLQIVQSAVPAPSTADRMIPPEVDPIVAKMLAKSLDARNGSAATVAELRSVSATLGVRSETAEIRDSMPRLPGRRTPAVGWLIAAVVLVAVGAFVWMATRVQ